MELMRQLEAQHERLWKNLPSTKPEMEASSDCNPKLLSGWTDCDISLWDVSVVDKKPGLVDILVALCRQKKNWEKISYLLFSENAVSSAGLGLTPSNGKTGDQRVDTSRTHFEIKGITGKELCTLLFYVANGDCKTGTFSKKDFDGILLEIYDKTKVRPVIQSDTSPTPQISLPSSGTGEQAEASEKTIEQEETQKITQTPNSSTG